MECIKLTHVQEAYFSIPVVVRVKPKDQILINLIEFSIFVPQTLIKLVKTDILNKW